MKITIDKLIITINKMLLLVLYLMYGVIGGWVIKDMVLYIYNISNISVITITGYIIKYITLILINITVIKITQKRIRTYKKLSFLKKYENTYDSLHIIASKVGIPEEDVVDQMLDANLEKCRYCGYWNKWIGYTEVKNNILKCEGCNFFEDINGKITHDS